MSELPGEVSGVSAEVSELPEEMNGISAPVRETASPVRCGRSEVDGAADQTLNKDAGLGVSGEHGDRRA